MHKEVAEWIAQVVGTASLVLEWVGDVAIRARHIDLIGSGKNQRQGPRQPLTHGPQDLGH